VHPLDAGHFAREDASKEYGDLVAAWITGGYPQHSRINDAERKFRARRRGSMPAKGSTEWKGDLPTGTGTFTAGGTISGGYTDKSRFEDGPGSNPEQLIAGARGLLLRGAANILAKAGTTAESIRTEPTVTLRPVGGTPTITKIALTTDAKVSGLDEAWFREHHNTAKAGWPVSGALAAVPEITPEASLAP
jgi:osmotically inducible protein OsmC